jgi:anti-sigma factor RsiW
MEQLLETTAELAHEGNTLRSGMPKPLHLALFVQRFKREVRAPFPPAWMVGALMAPLRAAARARGHHARYTPELALA